MNLFFCLTEEGLTRSQRRCYRVYQC